MKYASFIVLLLIISSCQKSTEHLIAKNQLGPLNNTTQVFEIETLLASDSVVKVNAKNAYGNMIKSAIGQVKVYDTSGKQLLSIKPHGTLDSVAKIKNIRILTDKYKTKNGISIGSNFAEVKKHHDVSRIQSSPRSIIITLEDLNAFVSFDRKVLSGDLRFDLDADIKPTMIPDDAKVNRFWLNFEAVKDAKQ
ncbi:MAG: hypothetical protein GVY05_01140 [Bacteroidetes bacterium]|jgi:hypothetical protein|nr:hypothetical protein [Bacteroidota bacterium]